MSAKLELLGQNLQKHLGDRIGALQTALGEVTIDVSVGDYIEVMTTLRDEPELRFEEMIDLCGVDFSTYKNDVWGGKRFAVVDRKRKIADHRLARASRI